ncbi:MAG: T9SS type A sorting domain-containing protein [Bacteroidota bacterium]|nr:T9SS type A sorting domain-containing protein [Bacteroidota bacterium]
MKEFYRFCSRAFFCLCLSAGMVQYAGAQVQTARFISTSANSNGFYEYLPAGYGSGSQTYPLMVFLHGAGEVGNGGSDLPLVLRNGPPKLINAGTFPTSFTVNGNSFSFIVLSPQFIDWPSEDDVDAVINYAIAHYRVDATRIYLTGLSMGGGATWDYPAYGGTNGSFAMKIAAILPVSGADTLYRDGSGTIAAANLPVYATHNQDDPIVPSRYTVANVIDINNSNPPPATRAIDTIFAVSGHDAWDKTYDPAFTNPRIGNLNVYQWLLQFTRNSVILPVTLISFTATLSQDQSQVDLNWNTAREQNNKFFTLERSADGQHFTVLDTVPSAGQDGPRQYAFVDKTPLPGKDFYRLSQTDIDGKTTYFSTLEVSLPAGALVTALRISPNPARTSILLELTGREQGTLRVRLSDAQGKLIRTSIFNKQGLVWDQLLDISGLAAGNYFIDVQGSSIHAASQFVKE